METLTMNQETQPLVVTVAQAAKMLTLSKAMVRILGKTGRLRVARIGRRVVVPIESLQEFVEAATLPRQ